MVTNLETFLPRLQNTAFFLFLIIILGISIRFFYFPFEVPIVTDGYFSFIYSASTVFSGELPIGYTVGNTGWANFLSLIFSLMEKTDPMYLRMCKELQVFFYLHSQLFLLILFLKNLQIIN